MVTDYLDDLELNTCLRINALSRNGLVRRFFSGVSRLGDYPAWVILGLATAVQLEGPALPFLMQSLLTAATGIVVYKLLKEKLVRERPFITHGDIICGTAPLDRYSFPSGHTLHSVSFAILYSSYAPAMVWIMAPFALLVAASRIILGLHYPSDVAVGAIIGAALASTSLALFT